MSTANRPVLAAIWMLGAVVSFSAMAVAGREAGQFFSTFEIMTYRSAIGLLILVGFVAATGRWSRIKTARPGLHIARNAAHFTGQNLWFFAVQAIPLAQVFAIEFTSPLWVIALAALFLGERLTLVKAAAGVIGFIGVLVVLRPGSAPLDIGHLSVAGAAICFAVTAIFTKQLTETERILTILFWLTLMQLVMGIVTVAGLGAVSPDGLHLPQGAQWLPLIVIALTGLAAHFSLTTALTLAPASVVMPLDFIRLPAIAVVGVIVYGEPFSVAVFIGAALIFGANYLNILASQRPS